MGKRLYLASILKTILMGFLLSLPALALADKSAKDDKGKTVASPRFFYKGDEAEAAANASNYVPKEAVYGGQVYTSELYQGPLEDADYSPSQARSLHDGFYMGAALGYDAYKMYTNINTIQNGVNVFQQSLDLDVNGISYMLMGGYGRVFDDPLYLGAELFYNVSQASANQNISVLNNNEGVYSIKSLVSGSYGASFLPGIKLGDSTLLFLKGGYARVQTKTYENSAVLGINNAESNGANGFSYGLGFEVTLYKNWSARGEYTHFSYKSFTTQVGAKMTPSDNQFMFGLVLHFV